MSFDLAGIAPMQWVLAVNPAQISTSQSLTIKYGQRSVDSSLNISVEPGVYLLKWDTNLTAKEWKSFYFRDADGFDTLFTQFGSLELEGTRRIVIPKKSNLRCYTTIESVPSVVEPVVAVTLIPIAPLANVFET